MNKRRVVITGLGIVSSIGNNKEEVLVSLKAGKSGIVTCQDYIDRKFRSHIHGAINLTPADHIEKRDLRFMGDGAAYNYIAMQEAIKDSGLEQNDVQNDKTGLIMGSGGPSTKNLLQAFDIAREQSPKRVGPFMVPRCMSSTNSATLSTMFGIRGVNYSITSACSTSAHCIGNAAQFIQMGDQDIMFAGGGEELDWTLTVLFDAMGALSSKYNDTPTKASRAFDQGRDGFVISAGGAVVVLEELEHAKARGAHIYAELVGYGLTSDGYDMVAPSGEGAMRCMQQALKHIPNQEVDYINAHGTSTPVGDTKELEAITKVFAGKKMPFISSTKSMTGHSLGATGAQEAIYSLLMMKHKFIAPSINIENVIEEHKNLPIVTERQDNMDIRYALSNSFGFGGTNCSLAFGKID